jgi:hypothetical protein
MAVQDWRNTGQIPYDLLTQQQAPAEFLNQQVLAALPILQQIKRERERKAQMAAIAKQYPQLAPFASDEAMAPALMGAMIKSTVESPFQQQEMGLRKQQIEATQKEAESRIAETAATAAQAHKDRVAKMDLLREIAGITDKRQTAIFDARQKQQADIKNMGIFGTLKKYLGYGINATGLPIPGFPGGQPNFISPGPSQGSDPFSGLSPEKRQRGMELLKGLMAE